MKVSGKVSLVHPEQPPINKIAEGDQESLQSFHRKADDPVTGKCLTWVMTGKERLGTLSSIVAVKTIPMLNLGRFSTSLVKRKEITG